MRLGVFHTTAPNPWGGTYTVKEDTFSGLLAAASGSGHELMVFSDDVTAASRFPTAGVTWVKVNRLRSRALLAFAKRRVNRLAAHGLLLPAPFASESLLDAFLLEAGI